MENISKFKWITIGCIAVFLFLVAAFYSNAKDISSKKVKEQQETTQPEVVKPQVIDSQDADAVMALRRIEHLQRQIDDLNAKVESLSSKSSNPECSVTGIMKDGKVKEMPAEDAIKISRDYNNEIVLSCNF